MHCINIAQSFLKEKLQEKVIRRGTEFVRPAHILDLYPLNFQFWAVSQKQVYLLKPESIGELIECAKQLFSSYSKGDD